MDDITGFLSH